MITPARARIAFLSLLACGMVGISCAAPAWAAPERSPILLKAKEDFWIGDFAALEAQNAALRARATFTLEGQADLTSFRDGIAIVFDNAVKPREPYLQELEALTLQWAMQHPQSALAHILHAKALVAHAWSYRGGGFAKEVSPQAWKEFDRYLRQAVAYLGAHADVAMSDSYGHLTLLSLGKGLNFNQKQNAAIAQEGLKRNPQDQELYFTVLTTLLPKWGGDGKALDRYIRQVAEQTKAEYGASLYARLYSAAASDEYGQTLFENSYADWTLMQQGYEDLLALYPDAILRRNRYAYFACMAKDKPVLQAQLAKLGARLDASAWGHNGERNLEGCQRWASEV